MLRILFTRGSYDLKQITCRLPTNYRRLNAYSSQSNGPAAAEHKEARTWLTTFNVDSIPKSAFEVTFSRSSGPGGQNVNKYICENQFRIVAKCQ